VFVAGRRRFRLFRGLAGVMRRLSLMLGRKHGVVRGLCVVAGIAEVSRLLMLACRVVVMRRCLAMMLRCIFGHFKILL